MCVDRMRNDGGGCYECVGAATNIHRCCCAGAVEKGTCVPAQTELIPLRFNYVLVKR